MTQPLFLEAEPTSHFKKNFSYYEKIDWLTLDI